MKDVGGRTAVITGASRGIGPYMAQALFDRGMRVVLAARSAGELEEVRARIDRSGRLSLAVAADVTRDEDRRELLRRAEERFGAVDVLVNNAGLEAPEAFTEMAWERIEALIDLNVMALMRLTQLALPAMLARRSGQVVNIASLAGLSPVPYNTVYSTSKHAVVGFSESLRYELAGTGVGVSAVCPGFIREAGMFTRYVSGGEDAGMAGTSSPQEVADAVVSAIRHNRGRVLVTPRLARATPLIRAVSPGSVYRMMQVGGILKSLRETAERNAAVGAAPASGNGRAAAPARRRRPKAD